MTFALSFELVLEGLLVLAGVERVAVLAMVAVGRVRIRARCV